MFAGQESAKNFIPSPITTSHSSGLSHRQASFALMANNEHTRRPRSPLSRSAHLLTGSARLVSPSPRNQRPEPWYRWPGAEPSQKTNPPGRPIWTPCCQDARLLRDVSCKPLSLTRPGHAVSLVSRP